MNSESTWNNLYQQFVNCAEKQQLVKWIEKQRTAYKKVTLSQEKIDLLNELNFDLK